MLGPWVDLCGCAYSCAQAIYFTSIMMRTNHLFYINCELPVWDRLVGRRVVWVLAKVGDRTEICHEPPTDR